MLEMKKRFLPTPHLASILILLAALGCSVPETENSRRLLATVLFDPRYVFQIETSMSQPAFPFIQGDIVEMNGTLIYHGPSTQYIRDILPSAEWFASLYPSGEWLGMERMRIRLRNQEGNLSQEIDWPVDNDDLLLIMSDSPPPPMLAVDPSRPQSREVCVYLQIIELEWVVEADSSDLLLTLAPEGAAESGLIRSEIHLCE